MLVVGLEELMPSEKAPPPIIIG